VCGAGSCTPTTCAAQGKNCGTISDGCSGTLACGTCTSPEVCGIGAEPNVCAVPCPLGCPSGFTCNLDGACAGGSETGIDLDVKTVTVSGTVTLNGAAPTPTSACGSSSFTSAVVTLTEKTYGYTFSLDVPCTSNTWSTSLFPGTYRATVQGYASNIPSAAYVASASLALTSSQTNIDLDVKTVTASGTVTINGATPTPTSACGSSSFTSAVVTLTETTYGYTFSLDVPCTSNAWSTSLFPGTYRATVQGYASNIPSAAYVAVDRILLP
jgi:hypothetical protein